MTSSLIDQVKLKVDSVKDLKNLNEIRLEFLGKSGLVSGEMRKLSELPNDQKKEFGQKINDLKNNIEFIVNNKKQELEEIELEKKLNSEWEDLTVPGKILKFGKIHPITQAELELINIFSSFGFNIKEGPDIESDYLNFTALNFAEDHPAKQMHDTFYLPTRDGEKMLLRTHTSPVQNREMKKSELPLRFVSPGRTYRSDYDQTHTPMFHQIEGVAIDEKVNMSHMKYIIYEFIHSFFEGHEIEIRFRPSFFPFTTPSAEVDIRFKNIKNAKWLEVLGCGMIHPNVLKYGGVDHSKYRGFAFGLGIERMAMLKYGINDLRLFFDSDIRWLKHYSFSTFDIPSLLGGLTR